MMNHKSLSTSPLAHCCFKNLFSDIYHLISLSFIICLVLVSSISIIIDLKTAVQLVEEYLLIISIHSVRSASSYALSIISQEGSIVGPGPLTTNGNVLDGSISFPFSGTSTEAPSRGNDPSSVLWES